VPVVDASVLVVALADDGPDGDVVRRRLQGERLFAPEIIDLEVLSVLRRAVARGALNQRRAVLALDDLMDAPIQRAPHRRLLARCWELRENLTPYDASYAALAEALKTVLITADARLSKAPGLTCRVEVITA
jgi:predicted nucleic acid-binding protein